MLHTRNNTDGNKLMIFYSIALYYGDTYIVAHTVLGHCVVELKSTPMLPLQSMATLSHISDVKIEGLWQPGKGSSRYLHTHSRWEGERVAFVHTKQQQF